MRFNCGVTIADAPPLRDWFSERGSFETPDADQCRGQGFDESPAVTIVSRFVSSSMRGYRPSGDVDNSVASSPARGTYTFDVDNRLVQAVKPTSTYTSAYDGLGDRIREVATGTGAYTNAYLASA